MDNLSNEDKIALASIAAYANKSTAETVGRIVDDRGRPDVYTAQKMGFKRVDFRNHINGRNPNYVPGNMLPPAPQFHEQFQDGNWQQRIPQNIQGFNQPHPNVQVDEYGVPLGNLNAAAVPLLGMPPGYQQPPNMVRPYQHTVENVNGFEIPDYNAPVGSDSPITFRDLVDEEAAFREALIKEVKAQKKSLNKLIREQEKLILSLKPLTEAITKIAEALNVTVELAPKEQPTNNEENNIDETKDKS